MKGGEMGNLLIIRYRGIEYESVDYDLYKVDFSATQSFGG